MIQDKGNTIPQKAAIAYDMLYHWVAGVLSAKLGVKFGQYRAYIRIPGTRLGLKVAIPGSTNILPVYLAAVTMNLIERKRYRYYGKQEKMINWGRLWTSQTHYDLCPTYATLGIINLVRHLDPVTLGSLKLSEDGQVIGIEALTHHDNKEDNYGVDEAGRILQLDYGDFHTAFGHNRTNIGNLDYR